MGRREKGKRTKRLVCVCDLFLLLFFFCFGGEGCRNKEEDQGGKGRAHGASMRWESGLVVLDSNNGSSCNLGPVEDGIGLKEDEPVMPKHTVCFFLLFFLLNMLRYKERREIQREER